MESVMAVVGSRMNKRYGGWQPGLQRGRLQWKGLARLALALLPLLAMSMTALAAPPPAKPAAAARLPATTRTVLVMGDSLSAGYGLAADQGWVTLAARKLAVTHPGWRVVNASISGETTAGGAARIARQLQLQRPAVVVIELGANDGLRGLDLEASRTNLERMIVATRRAGARVLLVGMRLPPNFGPQYTQRFAALFPDLAKRHQVAYLPFLLAPIADERNNFQADNMHPVAAVQGKLRDYVLPALVPLLR
jgi:acyl-CoA thioesterase-1